MTTTKLTEPVHRHQAHYIVEPALFCWQVSCRHCGWKMLATGPDLTRDEETTLTDHLAKHANDPCKRPTCNAPTNHTCDFRDEVAAPAMPAANATEPRQ